MINIPKPKPLVDRKAEAIKNNRSFQVQGVSLHIISLFSLSMMVLKFISSSQLRSLTPVATSFM